jgi:hypothetical protein
LVDVAVAEHDAARVDREAVAVVPVMKQPRQEISTDSSGYRHVLRFSAETVESCTKRAGSRRSAHASSRRVLVSDATLRCRFFQKAGYRECQYRRIRATGVRMCPAVKASVKKCWAAASRAIACDRSPPRPRRRRRRRDWRP